MRTILAFILIIALGITTWSCKGTKKVTESNGNINDSVNEIVLSNKPLDSLETDYFSIDSVSINNQILFVYVNYSGGCGDVKFEMFYTPQIMTVMPHRRNLALKLTDNDPCREIIQKKLAYDLSVFDKEARTGGVIININNSEHLYTLSE